MKIFKKIFKIVIYFFMSNGLMQPMILPQEPSPISTTKKGDGGELRSFIQHHLPASNKRIRMAEKILKYGIAPGVPFCMILADIYDIYQIDFIRCALSSERDAIAASFGSFIGVSTSNPSDIARAGALRLFVILSAISAGIYIAADKACSWAIESQNHTALKSLLTEWHKNSVRAPGYLQKIIDKLYSKSEAGMLTRKQSTQIIEALLALDSVLLDN